MSDPTIPVAIGAGVLVLGGIVARMLRRAMWRRQDQWDDIYRAQGAEEESHDR